MTAPDKPDAVTEEELESISEFARWLAPTPTGKEMIRLIASYRALRDENAKLLEQFAALEKEQFAEAEAWGRNVAELNAENAKLRIDLHHNGIMAEDMLAENAAIRIVNDKLRAVADAAVRLGLGDWRPIINHTPEWDVRKALEAAGYSLDGKEPRHD